MDIRAIKMIAMIALCCFIGTALSYFGGHEDDDCFCQLHGKIDDCTCSVDTVDYFNNVKIYPRLQSLLSKNYFRFYKVNLKRKCPFWSDDSACAIRFCHVKPCNGEELPAGLRGEDVDLDECDYNEKLGYLNTTISEKTKEDIELWGAFETANEDFCLIDENDEDAEYVDLLLNPERFTGYKGESAHRIWRTIYMENCFRPDTQNSFVNSNNPYIQRSILNGMCLEERAFYRALSGLHASINIHLCANYLLMESALTGYERWGHNMGEFKRRFSKEDTNSEGPNWLTNLYFVYLLELRALDKAAKYLAHKQYYTGDDEVDWDTQLAISDLLQVIGQFPGHFNESNMFSNHEDRSSKLKLQFRQHFQNISRIMDCVGCDKCRLWGKLQTQGLGTALKILFSTKEIEMDGSHVTSHEGATVRKIDRFHLKRSEIVSLINGIGKLSASIYELDEFRQMLR